MPYFILGVALLAGFLLAGRWYVQADPKIIIKVLKWSLITLVIAVALFFLLTGRIGLALAAIPALIPWFIRFRQAARMAKAFQRMAQGATGGNAATGQTSEVTTKFFHMVLDHDSGAMHGTITRGPHKGQTLASLNIQELLTLLIQCKQEDEQSAQVLEAWLNREHPDWQDDQQEYSQNSSSQNSSGPQTGTMSRQEALDVLGLDNSANDDDIREAHRHLIASMHPDKGGSTYLAAKINQAKDMLLIR